MDKFKVQLLVMASLGVVTGFAAGFVFANKKAEAKWAKISEEEIESVKDTYKKMHKEDEFETVESAATALGHEVLDEATKKLGIDKVRDIIRNAQYGTEDVLQVKTELHIDPAFTIEGMSADEFFRQQAEERGVAEEGDIPPLARRENIFDKGVEIDAEDLERRGTGLPYIITVQEYQEDEETYDKLTATYYEEDDVLVDSRDAAIPDVENTVGVANLERFGHGSDSMDSVYIRNELKHADFEVVRDRRSYTEVVLGVIQREEKNRPKKMRSDE